MTDKQPELFKKAILDNHQNKVYALSECDPEMIEHFPTRYIPVILSENLQSFPRSQQEGEREIEYFHPGLTFFRVNILRHLNKEEIMILRDWLSSYEKLQSPAPKDTTEQPDIDIAEMSFNDHFEKQQVKETERTGMREEIQQWYDIKQLLPKSG